MQDFMDELASNRPQLGMLHHVRSRVTSFVQHIGEEHFLGWSASNTLSSLLMAHLVETRGQLEFCPLSLWTSTSATLARPRVTSSGRADSQMVIEALCARLLQLVPPEVMALQIKTLHQQALYSEVYFHVQEHFELRGLLRKLADLREYCIYSTTC